METYQPIYDAVRSRISNGNVGHAIETAVRDANLSHYASLAAECVRETASEYERPSVLYRPALYPDGDSWCALYGEDLQRGVAGFGETPEKAMRAFDVAWYKETTPGWKRANGQFGVGA